MLSLHPEIIIAQTTLIAKGVNGTFYPTNSGGSITGFSSNGLLYNADSGNSAFHEMKVNGNVILRADANNVTVNKPLNCSSINPNQDSTIGGANYTTTINGKLSTSTVVTNTVFCGVPTTSLYSGTVNRTSSSQNITLPTSAYSTIGIRCWGGGGGGGAGIAYFTGSGSGSTFTLKGFGVSEV